MYKFKNECPFDYINFVVSGKVEIPFNQTSGIVVVIGCLCHIGLGFFKISLIYWPAKERLQSNLFVVL